MPPQPAPSQEELARVQEWFEQWYSEVEEQRRAGHLAHSTAATYLLHSGNFVRWLEGRFRPGSRSAR